MCTDVQYVHTWRTKWYTNFCSMGFWYLNWYVDHFRHIRPLSTTSSKNLNSSTFQGSSHHIHIVHIPLSNLSSFWVQHIPEWVCLVCAAQRLSLLEEGLAVADLGWGSGARRRFAVIFFTFHSLIFWTRGLCTNCGFHVDDFWCI